MKIECNACVFAADGKCGRYDFPINKETDGCPGGRTELPKICSLCGQYIIDPGSLDADKPEVILCDNCFNLRHKCPSCVEVTDCVFETDPSSIPKVVEQRIQQGPMLQIMQVKNPARIEVTCKTKCKCWDEEYGCMREIGTCGQWNPRY